MQLLALKLVLTPFLIGGPSLAARRWGPAVAGWLAFFTALLSILPTGGVGAAFPAAITAALAVQAISLRLLRAAPEPGEVMA